LTLCLGELVGSVVDARAGGGDADSDCGGDGGGGCHEDPAAGPLGCGSLLRDGDVGLGATGECG
jgi:hypothetical protein